MLQIVKQGNSLVVKGINHSHYPYNGTIEIPLNSVICVIEEASDIVTFRSASNYDILFSGVISEVTINGNAVTKDTIAEAFGEASNVPTGGGGEGGTTNYNDLSNKPTLNGKTLVGAVTIDIPEVPTNVSAFTNDAGYLTEHQDISGKADKSEIPTKTSQLTNDSGYLTQHQDISGKADKSEIPTKTSQLTNDSGFLTQHQDISGLATKTEVNEGLATKAEKDASYTKSESDTRYLQSFTESDPVWNAEKGDYLKKTDAANTYQPKGDYVDTSELARVETLANKGIDDAATANTNATSALNGLSGKQNTLVSGTSIKTINGESILGSGNIEVHGEGGDVSSVNGKTGDVVLTAGDISATGFETIDEAIQTANDNASTAITDASNAAAVAESAQNDANQAMSEAQAAYELAQSKQDAGDYVERGEMDVYALKSELPDVSDMETKTHASATYQPKGDYATQTDLENIQGGTTYTIEDVLQIANRAQESADQADGNASNAQVTADEAYNLANELSTNKQDKLTSGTNIKTINGESILGSGDITISGSGAVDSVNGKTGTVVLSASDINTESMASVEDAILVAYDTANNAISEANDAYTKASEVESSLTDYARKDALSSVEDKADNAQNDANTANTIATQAQSDVDELKAEVEELQLVKIPNLTMHGDLTVNHGQLSAFSVTNYAQFPFEMMFEDPWELDLCITTPTTISAQQNILDSDLGLALALDSSANLIVSMGFSGTSWDIAEAVSVGTLSLGTTYYIKIIWDGSTYTIGYSRTKDGTYTTFPIESSFAIHDVDILIGRSYSGNAWGGSMNMNYWYMYINGEEHWQGMDDVGLATRLATDLSNIDEIGEEKVKSIAWNETFEMVGEMEDGETVTYTIVGRLKE